MFKIGEVVFAKVKGWCPWPGKIMCRVARNQFKIFFYGTSQESLVKSDCIWSCKENLDEFSKKYGTKKDYFRALEEMKKTPDVFKVSSSDLCAHECLTCDPKRRIKEPTRGKKGFQMSKSNVKVGVKKTKDNVQDFKAKDEVVSKNKAFKKIVKSKQRIKKARRSHRDNAFKKLLGKKFHLSQIVNDQVTAKKKSFKKILNSKQTIDKEARHENVVKESLGKEVAVEDKAELGIQQKNAVNIKKREGRWICSNETKNKEKNLNVETESNTSKATEAQLGKGGAKMSESLMELSLTKEIKDLPKATMGEDNYESEVVPVISLKPGSIEVVTIASNNNESEEILNALMDVDGGKGKLKNYDVEMSAVDESKTLQKFKYTFKEVDMSNASFPYGGITGTESNMQSQAITSKGVDHIESTENTKAVAHIKSTENTKGVDHIESTENTKAVVHIESTENPKGVDHIESTENAKGVDHIESTENIKAVVHIESTENTKECSEMTQKIKEPVEKINLEDSITEVWLKEDENEREAKTMMDIDNIIYGEDVLDLDVSYTMLDLSQENGELSEVIQAGSTGDTLKELMDVEAVTEVPDMGSPLNFEFFTWGND